MPCPQFNKLQRRQIQKLAKMHQLQVSSEGGGQRRYLTLDKTSETLAHDKATMKEFLMLLSKFGEQSKLDDVEESEQAESNVKHKRKRDKGKQNQRAAVFSRRSASPENKSKAQTQVSPIRLKEGSIVGEHASPIEQDNIGSKMLRMMGWKPGTGLGANADGMSAPLPAVYKNTRMGLGFE
jgi:hypothetical protein